ncbi:Hsp20/alpha crystallin family protein [Halobaculum sp. EA56]|uniref:Hsp20/alpha crystallin family protein n=1 Tax=Halobaculum sp. EA56 TaxID=3421648 RepID=UPI003EBCBD1D
MLPVTTPSSWTQSLDLPSRLFPGVFGAAMEGVELYEEDDAFVLTVDMPGFEREEIDVTWDEGRLNVAAEHVDDAHNSKKTYHRSFRLPKDIEEDGIAASYRNGVLEVTLPIPEDAIATGTRIEVEG